MLSVNEHYFSPCVQYVWRQPVLPYVQYVWRHLVGVDVQFQLRLGLAVQFGLVGHGEPAGDRVKAKRPRRVVQTVCEVGVLTLCEGGAGGGGVRNENERVRRW